MTAPHATHYDVGGHSACMAKITDRLTADDDNVNCRRCRSMLRSRTREEMCIRDKEVVRRRRMDREREFVMPVERCRDWLASHLSIAFVLNAEELAKRAANDLRLIITPDMIDAARKEFGQELERWGVDAMKIAGTTG